MESCLPARRRGQQGATQGRVPLALCRPARSGAWAPGRGSRACSFPAAAAAGAASGGRAVETGDMLVLVATASGASLPADAAPTPASGTPWGGRGIY